LLETEHKHRKILTKENTADMNGNAYIMVVLGILLAKGLGFYRDMVFAGVFGTGTGADIYFQVFGLVNLIFTGIGVALSTLVIKNINQSHNVGREKAYAADFIKKSMLYLLAAIALIAVCAKPIVKVILPEISGKDFDLAVRLMYIMLPSLMFVVVAYIISGILQNEKVYFVTSVMSLPFNAAIILSLNIPGVSIETVGAVTTLGWFLHILILIPSFIKKGYGLKSDKHSTRNKAGSSTEILWIFISNMMFQICFYADRAFVSGDAGMASTFNYASNLFITISSVFVVAMSTVVFPAISKNYEEGNKDYVNELLRYIITVMVAIFGPFLMVAGLFGEDVIRLVYERGSFTSESTKAVASMFFIYSLGILGYVCQELFNKILYLAGKYKYTVIGTIAVIGANLIINLAIRFLDVSSSGSFYTSTPGLIGISTSVLLTLYAVAIAIGIRKVIGPYWKKSLIKDLIKIGISLALAFTVYVAFKLAMPEFTHGYVTFIVAIGACAVVYIAALYFTGMIKRLLKRETKGEQ